MQFEVWAPRAQVVELELADGLHAMTREEGGLWRVDRPAESGRTRYRYRLDGGPGLPDPRSRWQPEGVHAWSCVWDTADFARRRRASFPETPLREAVLYEIHVGTFSPEGTYAGVAARLPHLRELGVTHLEIMPVASFPGERGWGYDGVFPFAPHPAYGTPEDLVSLVEASHAHGLGVLLDVVYNHLGPDGNYLGRFAPYFTSLWKTPWGDALNFDGPGSDQVRAFVIENALMWLRDYGFDGLRLDAAPMLIDHRAVHILEELGQAVSRLAEESGRQIVLTAESDRNDPRYVRPVSCGGYGLQAHWVDDVHHALQGYFTGERDGYYVDFGSLRDVATALEAGYVLQGQYSAFRGRGHGRPPEGVRPEQMIACAQNHDHVGNRPQGDRLSMLLEQGRLEVVAALVLLGPFTPLLFQGEEWGAQTPFLYFTDHHNEALGRAVTEGRRNEFSYLGFHEVDVPDPQARATFERSKLGWEELEVERHRRMLEWYRALLALRREYITRRPVTHDVRWNDEARWLLLRVGRLCTVANLAGTATAVPFPPGREELLLHSHPQPRSEEAIPPWSVEIWRCQAGSRLLA